MGSVNFIPYETIFNIFFYLTPKELCDCCKVSKVWNEIASDPVLWRSFNLSLLFPTLSVIDASVWKTNVKLASLGFKFDDPSPVNSKKTILKIQMLMTRLKKNKIVNNGGYIFLTIPQGFSENKLQNTAGKILNIDFLSNSYFYHYKEQPVVNTYQILITNDIFSTTCNLNSEEVKKTADEIGIDIPQRIEIVALAVANYAHSSVHSYVNFTYCFGPGDVLDQVGGFTRSRRMVFPSFSIVSGGYKRGESVGLGGVFRLEASEK